MKNTESNGILDGQVIFPFTLNKDELDIIKQALRTEIYQRHKLSCNTTKVEQLLEKVKKELEKSKED